MACFLRTPTNPACVKKERFEKIYLSDAQSFLFFHVNFVRLINFSQHLLPSFRPSDNGIRYLLIDLNQRNTKANFTRPTTRALALRQFQCLQNCTLHLIAYNSVSEGVSASICNSSGYYLSARLARALHW
ncbi:MAG: hypothetical protein B9S32_02090 [Verrucomicrobia bacterium Tous-C9LFEB]|nr:MAG: hypothetical protein B9S32_02090 [Verrucomicrobia bacterium Tous-C9LFEB]